MSETLAERINQLQRRGLVLGLVFLAVTVAGAFFNSRQFYVSYLFAYLFWLGLSLGCLCVAMIHHLTGGRWGDVTRRFLEAGYMTLPMMTLFFLPILTGLHELYPWVNGEIPAHKAIYLNVPAFAVRAFVYFFIWLLMAYCLRKWSQQQDWIAELAPTQRARTLSGPGVVLYTLTVTFAWTDWLMSLEPDWYSTMFPVTICGGQILSTFALAILLLARFRDAEPFSPVVGPGQFHQLGNLLLTFVMFWTYVCFGQLLIIWSGNLPREIGWYLHRIAGGWKWIASFLVLFNFFLPFFLLLFRASKTNFRPLRILAALVFLCQLVNSYWLVEPSVFPNGLHIHWLDFTAPAAIGGLWTAMFAVNLKNAPLLTRNDPRISYSFAHAE